MKYTTKRPAIHRARFRAVYVFAPFLLAGLVLLGGGAPAALARTDVPPPAGPSLESWVPPAYALGDPNLTELERQAYADDYHAMLSGGAIETTNSATLEDTQRVTGVLDNGQAPGQDGNIAALYQDGVLVWGRQARRRPRALSRTPAPSILSPGTETSRQTTPSTSAMSMCALPLKPV